MKTSRTVAVNLLVVSIYGIFASLATGQAVTLDVTYTDNNQVGSEEGFFDPVLGQARRDAFEKALDIWAEHLEGSITVFIKAEFNSLGPDIAGGALFTRVVANLGGLPEVGFGYVAPLASQLLNQSIVALPGEPHAGFSMYLQFNSDLDLNAPGNGRFDYTIGAPNPGDNLFLSTALHELGHGFGMTHSLRTVLDPNPPFPVIGVEFRNGLPFIYDKFLHERQSNGATEDFVDMTDAERLAAATGGRMFYKGPAIVAAAIPNPPQGPIDPNNPPVNSFNEAKVHAPSALNFGGSLIHLDIEHMPDNRSLLMEPTTTSQVSVDYTREVMFDLGWILQTPAEVSVSPASLSFQSTAVGGDLSPPLTVTITNSGTIDLEILSISIEDGAGSPGSAANYNIATGGSAGILSPSQTRDVTVEFVPVTAGFKIANLLILTSDPRQWSENVLLTGSAISGTAANVWVDFLFAGEEQGTQALPFDTMIEGSTFVTAGGIVNIQPGTTAETLTIEKAMTLVNAGPAARDVRGTAGVVRIGVQSMSRSIAERSKSQKAQVGFVSRRA